MTEKEIDFDRNFLGMEHTTGSIEVTKEMIQYFCKGVGETNPLFTDEEAAKKGPYGGIVAPPTFPNVVAARLGRPDINLNFGKVGFHAGEATDYLAPVRPGDVLTCKTRLKHVYTKTGRTGTMVFCVWESILTNQDGVKVAVVRDSRMRR